MLSLYSNVDLFTIKAEVLPIAPKWKSFCLALGMHIDALSRIDSNHRKVEDCLEDALCEWLSLVSTPRGIPSWELIVEAVAHDAGGNNKALAQEIARNHNGIR